MNSSIENATFLITGGAGFIGSNICQYLLDHNAKHVRVLDNLSNGHLKNIQDFISLPNFEFIEGDIRDIETCNKAVQGIDYVSHQAALGSVPRSINDPVTTNEVNISGFLNMLVAVKDSDVKKMVYAASSSTYGDSQTLPKVEENIGKPLSPYAVTKYVNELYADVFHKTYGIKTVGLRYFNIYGPKQDPNGAYAAVIPLFMKAINDGAAPTMNGDGEQTRDFTFVGNAVQANIKALFSSDDVQNEVINIACNERISLNILWEAIQDAANKKLAPIYGPSRKGDVRDSLANIDKAKNLIGYEPQVLVKDGIKKTYDWFIQNQDFINQ
ncbi:SDR family oxidoreductase [Cyclobacteriaceae bacterium]|nr:SDR family oxidoreductase [Cyclobacteriaceae bacterium]